MKTFCYLVSTYINTLSPLNVQLYEKLNELIKNPPIIKNNDYIIAYCGPMGILVWNQADVNDYSSIGSVDITELWNIPIDIENWQKEALPYIFIKNGVDEKEVLKLILEDINVRYTHECIGKLGEYNVYISNKDNTVILNL
jgi:hypothetical protein